MINKIVRTFCVIIVMLAMTFTCLPTAQVSSDVGDVGYVMTYFVQTGDWWEQYPIRMAFSYDGYLWTPINGGNPVISGFNCRDPHIFKKPDGSFVIVTTGSNGYINVIESSDLHTFSTPRQLYVGPSNCVDTWAPEVFLDPSDGKFMIIYTARLDGQTKHKVYYAKTTDFNTCTSTGQLLYQEGTADTYDGSMIRNGSYYYLYYANGDTHELKVVRSTSATGTFSAFMSQSLTTVSEYGDAEGPFIFKEKNADKWVLYYDKYYNNGHFGCLSTTNLNTTTRSGWTKLTEYTQYLLPAGVRHGKAVAVNQEDLNDLVSLWQMDPVHNRSFDFGGATQSPKGWLEWGNADASYTSTSGPNPGYGSTCKLAHMKSTAYTVYTYQEMYVPNGTYNIGFFTCRSSGANSSFIIKGYGGGDIWQGTSNNSAWHWQGYTVNVTSGYLQIGFYTTASTANQWSCFDDVYVIKQ